jgi:hypothetical protein
MQLVAEPAEAELIYLDNSGVLSAGRFHPILPSNSISQAMASMLYYKL